MNVAIVAVGYFAGHFQAGLFGFSFVLAAQANTVIVGRLGVVLQPVLAKLRTDPTRQVHGFLRAQRALGSVCVPAALLQAVVAEPLFQLLLDPKWQPAVPVFQALSLMQALYFASAPSMACLKAQGRFRTLLLWQAVHLLASLGAYCFASRRFGAVGAASAGVILWAISAPVAIWICSSFPNGGPPTPRTPCTPQAPGYRAPCVRSRLFGYLAASGVRPTWQPPRPARPRPPPAGSRLVDYPPCGARVSLSHRSRIRLAAGANVGLRDRGDPIAPPTPGAPLPTDLSVATPLYISEAYSHTESYPREPLPFHHCSHRAGQVMDLTNTPSYDGMHHYGLCASHDVMRAGFPSIA